ncbi:LuxR C-terminal-related transcriptional regulator [Cryptosporangium minutisporangium]|uniref:LuxR family transcriptional regulator n=1 Tax=Cryptosporangium minutisporangium TaxID=113569 RepID=A0ABP6SY04_9ACTN
MATDVAITLSGSPAFSPPGGNPLLESKFAIPEPPPFLVTRSRLWGTLTAATHDPVAVVVGSAGAGKTQLVASWLRSRTGDGRAVWITLEEGDGDPAVLWTYVLEGLRRAGLDLPTSAQRPFPGAAAHRSFLAWLAGELATMDQPVTLVLDGTSCIDDDYQWATDLDFVLRHARGRLQAILIGRSDPPLPLHRYRLAGRLTEIHSRELAFSPAETAELMDLHGITLTDGAMAALLQRTEGWAAGLRLVAMALAGRVDADQQIADLTGDDAGIAEYFLGEVLRTQHRDVRTFLLETSILDVFTPELADAVTGRSDSRRMLAALRRVNAFVVSVDGHAAVYRYHRLFADLLRTQLALDAPDRLIGLQERAARWHAANGDLIRAVEHAIAAGNPAAAAALVIQGYAIGELALHGRRCRPGELLAATPEPAETPESALVLAALATADGETERCARLLDEARALLLERNGGDCPDPIALAGILLEVLLAQDLRHSVRVVHSARVADVLLRRAPPEVRERRAEADAILLAARGVAESRLGQLDDAVGTLRAAVTAAGAAGCAGPRREALEQLALIEAHRGRLRQAAALAGKAREAAEHGGTAGVHPSSVAELTLAWVAAERYDVEQAWHHLRAAAAHPPCDPAVRAGAALVRARLLRARGELREARAALDVSAGDPPPLWLERELALNRARLAIAAGQPAEAEVILRTLDGPDDADTTVVRAAVQLAVGELDRAQQLVQTVVSTTDAPASVLVDAWLLLATIAAEDDDPDRAHRAVRQALRAASPESLRRPFNEIGPALRRLLREAPELRDRLRLPGTDQAEAPRRGPAPEDDPVLVEPLSKREMDVLLQMAAMLPSEEIAATLYVSINTVKTHVRSIFRKLSVSRRSEAVRRARALGLI